MMTKSFADWSKTTWSLWAMMWMLPTPEHMDGISFWTPLPVEATMFSTAPWMSISPRCGGSWEMIPETPDSLKPFDPPGICL